MQIEHLLCGTIHLHNDNALTHTMGSFHNLSTKDANLCITCSLINSPQLANKENGESREERPKLLSFPYTILQYTAFCKSRLTRLLFTKKTFWVNQKIKFNFSHWEAHQRAYKYAFLERLSLNLTVNEGTSSVLATFWTQSAQTSSVQKYKELMIRKNLSLHFPGMFKVLSFYMLSHPLWLCDFPSSFFFLNFSIDQILLRFGYVVSELSESGKNLCKM